MCRNNPIGKNQTNLMNKVWIKIFLKVWQNLLWKEMVMLLEVEKEACIEAQVKKLDIFKLFCFLLTVLYLRKFKCDCWQQSRIRDKRSTIWMVSRQKSFNFRHQRIRNQNGRQPNWALSQVTELLYAIWKCQGQWRIHQEENQSSGQPVSTTNYRK